MQLLNTFRVVLISFFVLGSPGAAFAEKQKVLVVGDSLLDWHRIRGTSIPQVLARQTGWTVRNRASTGAAMSGKVDETNPRTVIPGQYEAGPWDWVVINGGGNDMLFKCGCARCNKVLNSILSKDGKRGIMADLVKRAKADGAQVVMVGYIGNPRPNLFSGCKDEVLELVRRQKLLASRDRSVSYFSTREIIDINKRASFALDGFHPSQKSTRRIGAYLAATMKQRSPKK